MKKLAHMTLALSFMFTMHSCSSDEQGSSTPIDSTNLNGTAPATYGPSDTDSMTPPVYEGQNDTGYRANTASSEDSMKGRQ